MLVLAQPVKKIIKTVIPIKPTENINVHIKIDKPKDYKKRWPQKQKQKWVNGKQIVWWYI